MLLYKKITKGSWQMVRLGSGLIVLSALLWIIGYAGLFFESFILWISAIILGVIGALLLFIGVFRDRLKENEEDDKNDYSKY